MGNVKDSGLASKVDDVLRCVTIAPEEQYLLARIVLGSVEGNSTGRACLEV